MQRLSSRAWHRQSINHRGHLEPDEMHSDAPHGLSDLAYSTNGQAHKSTAQTLEERIQYLETQNDFLFRFINYFREFLPALGKPAPPVVIQVQEEAPGPEGEPLQSNTMHVNKPLITKRELEVLQLIAEGLSAKEIAHKLFISETTVITHKKNLKGKFNVRNTAELINKTNSFLLG